MEKVNRTVPWNEVANAVTHGLGTGLAIAALVILVVCASIYGNVWHIVSFSIYGATLVILYLCSTSIIASGIKGKHFFGFWIMPPFSAHCRHLYPLLSLPPGASGVVSLGVIWGGWRWRVSCLRFFLWIGLP